MSNNTISTTGSDAANQYRKKPVVIEAIHYTGAGNFADPRLPDWMWKALETGVAFNRKGELMLKTLEGEHLVSPGDWVVRGVKGELYPCKPDIFAATYEQASATDSDAVDLDKLEALAKAARLSALRPGIQAQAKDYFGLVHAMTPDTVLALIAQARAAAPVLPNEFAWPEPPASKGQSHVLFEDGYAEGWAKAIDTVRAMFSVSAAPTATAEPVAVILQARSPEGDPWQEVIADDFFKAHRNGYEVSVCMCKADENSIRLEIAAPAPQQAPLTDARIEQIWDEVPLTGAYTMAEARIKFARAIERELSAGSAASAGDTPPKDFRSLILGQAVAHHGCVWPAELWTGVMHFNGQRITKAEFDDRAAMAATEESKQ